MKKYEYSYKKAETLTLQGNKQKALDYANRYNLEIVYENNGFYRLASKAYGTIYEVESEEILREKDPRNYILNNYNCERLTEKKVKEVTDKLNSGDISFEDI